MPRSNSMTIANQTVQAGTPTVVVSLSWTAVSPVNILAGQSLTSSTLNTDAAPSTYPQTGNDQISVTVQDAVGNTFPVIVTYTGVSGNSFTGCTAQNPDPTFTTLLALATPNYTGTVTINRTGSGNHPWLNTLTAADSLVLSIQWSSDGGTTWNDAASNAPGGWAGGPQTDKHGNPLTANSMSVSGLGATANAARAVVTANGSNIFVGGNVTVTSR